MGAVVFVGLGSNLDDPRRQLEQAFSALDSIPDTHCRRRSRLYRSAPMGPADQPDYLNAVAELETELEPLDLLAALQAIEQAQGRVRNGERWGPRTLDLDILLFANQCIDQPALRVPHPGLAQRAFVLYPLYEIAGDIEIPGLGPLSGLLKHCSSEELELLDDA